MRSITITLITLFLLILTAPVLAGDSPQEQRQEAMKDVGGAAKSIGQMLKGETAFDAAEANAGLAIWAEVADVFGDLFPEGSDSGFETEAHAAIWTDRAGFDAELLQFGERAEAAVAAAPQDLDGLKAAAGPVFKSCKSCHESYRVDQ